MLLQLASIGILIALVPLCYVLAKRDRSKYRKLARTTAFLTLDLIIFGNFTRLADLGLDCLDQSGCYSTSSPFHAHEGIHATQAAMPGGLVT